MVGTSVRDRKYDASMAKTTARASGMNSDAAGPVRNTTGTKTMQIQMVDTNAGAAIWAALSRIAWRSGCFMPRKRWVFSSSTVASSTRMPTARAMPPSVMMLSDWPSAHRTMMDVRIDSGIDVATMSVLRHEPRKSRIMRAVSPAAMAPSRSTPSTAAFTNTDWSKRNSILSAGGSWA